MAEHDHHDHSKVEHLDAASTLAEREPVRVMVTTPAAILGLTTTILTRNAADRRRALITAVAFAAACGLLELVRSRVSPAPAPHI